MRPGSAFHPGEACLILDTRGKRYLVQVEPGGKFHYHRGYVAHDDIIGTREGAVVRSSKGSAVTVLRPRLADYVLRMDRGPAVVYPKDAGAILVWADLRPGLTVLEAGTGSAGLTMVLARAILPDGRLISVERRADHAALARSRIEGFFGAVPGHVELLVGDVEDVILAMEPDRVILDVPEPWHVVDAAAERLVGGGILCCYLPTVPQVQQLRNQIESSRSWTEVGTFEILMRDWSVSGKSVRPEHRMVGHTGFITTARKRDRGDGRGATAR